MQLRATASLIGAIVLAAILALVPQALAAQGTNERGLWRYVRESNHTSCSIVRSHPSTDLSGHNNHAIQDEGSGAPR